jgi:hypothetical protein
LNCRAKSLTIDPMLFAGSPCGAVSTGLDFGMS